MISLVYKNNLSTFIRRDIDLLGASPLFVNTLSIRILKQIAHIPQLIRSEKIYVWFCDYHAFIPVLIGMLFNREVKIIVGGYDASNVSRIKYGLFYGKGLKCKIRQGIAMWCYKNATEILPVSEHLRKKLIGKGIKSRTVSPAFDPEFYKPGRTRSIDFLTVAIINDYQTFLLKGIDKFLEFAKQMKSHSFVIAGSNVHFKRPENVTVLGELPEDKIRDLMQASKVYCQFSMSEGFPNALGEAMLCGCLPAVTNVCEDIVGASGVVNPDVKDMRDLAYTSDHRPQSQSRAREIMLQYTKSKRLESL